MTEQRRSRRKPVDYYLDLSYEIEVQKAEEGGFVVSIPVLPGCITQVEEWGEAEDAIEEVRRHWIQVAHDDGVDIPLPKSQKEYSGKFVLRIPRSMHRGLDRRAEDERVSLNTLVVSLIAQSLGSRNMDTDPDEEGPGEERWASHWETLMSRPPREPARPRLSGRSHFASTGLG